MEKYLNIKPDYKKVTQNNYLSKADYKDGYYNEFGANGSARDFYIASSNGNYLPDFDVYGPIQVTRSSTYYGVGGGTQNVPSMIVEAIKKADEFVDFSQYDTDGDGYVDECGRLRTVRFEDGAQCAKRAAKPLHAAARHEFKSSEIFFRHDGTSRIRISGGQRHEIHARHFS